MTVRLTEVQLQRLAERLLADLVQQAGAKTKAERGKIIACMVATLKTNLEQEQDLEKEAMILLEAHLRQAPPGIDRQKLLLMIKKKLAAERGVAL